MIYLEAIRANRKTSLRNVQPGQRVPMELTSLGRAYLAAILPFHRFGIGHLLAAAAQRGRLKPAEGGRARLA